MKRPSLIHTKTKTINFACLCLCVMQCSVARDDFIYTFYLCFLFALYERKKETQKKIKYRSAEGEIADCVSRVI